LADKNARQMQHLEQCLNVCEYGIQMTLASVMRHYTLDLQVTMCCKITYLRLH